MKITKTSTPEVRASVPAPRRVQVPAAHAVSDVGFGNLDVTDMIVPRLKLLQGLSPEVKDDPRRNIQGEFYHTGLGDCIGGELTVVPLYLSKSYELWAPRDNDLGLLARSADCITWDKPHQKFEVKIKNRKVIWDTKGSVAESGLAEWGSSDPANPRSPPVAALTYRVALHIVGRAELSPCMLILTRTATKPAQDLYTRGRIRASGGTPLCHQQYLLLSADAKSGPNEYFLPQFRNAGNVEDRLLMNELAETALAMSRMNVRTEDENPLDEDTVSAPNGERAF